MAHVDDAHARLHRRVVEGKDVPARQGEQLADAVVLEDGDREVAAVSFDRHA